MHRRLETVPFTDATIDNIGTVITVKNGQVGFRYIVRSVSIEFEPNALPTRLSIDIGQLDAGLASIVRRHVVSFAAGAADFTFEILAPLALGVNGAIVLTISTDTADASIVRGYVTYERERAGAGSAVVSP